MLPPLPDPDVVDHATAPSGGDDESPCLIPLADLRVRLRMLPTQPGVYLMRDAQGRILYVGKAGVLRTRVRSYFQKQDDLGLKVRHLVSRIAAFDWIVTATEQEALILENNLLKEHHPRYNIKLRDDKQYLYLRVTMGQRYPRVGTVRRTASDGSRYFGPYTDSGALRETIKHLQRLFLFRTCTLDMERTYPRACLLFHIKRCSAPCVRAIEEESYRESVKHLLDFLEGRGKSALDALRASMAEAAESLQFERAAALRDRVRAAEQIVEKQRITSVGRGDLDAIAFAADGDDVVAQVFTVRDDNVVGREEFVLQDAGGVTPEEVAAQFLQQYYARATFVPPLMLVPVMPSEDRTLRAWLSERRAGAVRLEVPQRGPKHDLLELVSRNARLALERLRTEWLADRRRTSGALR
ncbi:MAG: excinuclease ABC subunit C, partial [Proteobacteria bacterium]|nr:excinuclease ABC subunit C [Pseudomonadota bacterium]